ncbi:hypothetical protein J3998_00825 [Thiomicrorhabdus sp. 6S2-11]|uniref:DUF3108 domain-containing protein n=1 Tax=Thiomicrorhabdus marina TaxID=2818442 RepID=A0ABS3Q1A6_9GAMM|nr:DUF3108 domain-containing protein [Thiomicrorhabdus marina]MBO1926105.1 hypothetical protein [Thiomicrorhabdus marina]
MNSKEIFSHFEPKRIVTIFIGCSLFASTLFSSNALATATSATSQHQEIPNFQANFLVNLYGMDLGNSKHVFNCSSDNEDDNSNCELTTESIPKGLASWFVKDSAIETIKIQQSTDAFLWQGYQKHIIRSKGSDKKDKFQTYQVEDNKVAYLEKALQFDWSSGLFDTTSIVYAIQWYALNQIDINQAQLKLQSGRHQYDITFKEQYQKSRVQLEYDRLEAEKFSFGNARYEIDLWLLPQTHYFPGKVRIHDRDEDQTLTLTLQQAPEFD